MKVLSIWPGVGPVKCARTEVTIWENFGKNKETSKSERGSLWLEVTALRERKSLMSPLLKES